MITLQVYFITHDFQQGNLSYPFDFGAANVADIKVYDLDPNLPEGDEGRMTLIPGAYVAPAAGGITKGGTVTLPQNLQVGHQVYIVRVTPKVQTATYLSQQKIRPEAIERSLDILTMIVQEMEGNLSGNVEALFDRVELIEGDVVVLNQSVADLSSSVGNLYTLNTALNGRVGNLEQTTAATNKTVLNIVAKNIEQDNEIRDVRSGLQNHVSAANPHPQYIRKDQIGDITTDGIFEMNEYGDIRIRELITQQRTDFFFINAYGDVAIL